MIALLGSVSLIVKLPFGLIGRLASGSPAGVSRRAREFAGSVPWFAAVAVTSWAADPWAGGAYTHIPPGASPADADLLGDPVGGRLLSAGEHTQSARLAYADGALTSGIREAKRLLGTPAVRLTVNHASKGA